MSRCLPYWHSTIAPAILRGERVLVAAHGNSLRGIVKHLEQLSDDVSTAETMKQIKNYVCMQLQEAFTPTAGVKSVLPVR